MVSSVPERREMEVLLVFVPTPIRRQALKLCKELLHLYMMCSGIYTLAVGQLFGAQGTQFMYSSLSGKEYPVSG